MERKINIAICPLDIAWGDCEENLLNVSSKLPKLRKDTDVLILPELFSTGFIQDEKLLNQVAHMGNDMTLAALKGWSERSNVAICGSYLAAVGNDIFNRGFFIEPSGETTFYDKAHLFCLSPENKLFSSGKEMPPVVRFRGWNFSFVICYDLRFPVWCRNFGERYDALLVPANWPEARGYAWKQLLIARAIENQAVVVGANRSGRDDFGVYNHQSFIFDPLGKVIASNEKADDESDFIYATYSKDELDKVRKFLPVGNDADSFQICKL